MATEELAKQMEKANARIEAVRGLLARAEEANAVACKELAEGKAKVAQAPSAEDGTTSQQVADQMDTDEPAGFGMPLASAPGSLLTHAHACAVRRGIHPGQGVFLPMVGLGATFPLVTQNHVPPAIAPWWGGP